VMEITVEDLVF